MLLKKKNKRTRRSHRMNSEESRGPPIQRKAASGSVGGPGGFLVFGGGELNQKDTSTLPFTGIYLGGLLEWYEFLLTIHLKKG